MIALRNVSIIALLALGVAVLPGGGNVASALLATLGLVFMAAIALLIGRVWRETSLSRDSMDEKGQRLFYGSLGALALMVVGLDEMWDTGLGLFVWFMITGTAIFLAVLSWREANSY